MPKAILVNYIFQKIKLFILSTLKTSIVRKYTKYLVDLQIFNNYEKAMKIIF
jgi:hypothetical protein